MNSNSGGRGPVKNTIESHVHQEHHNRIDLIILQIVMAVESVIKLNSATIIPRGEYKISKQSQQMWLNEMVYTTITTIPFGKKTILKANLSNSLMAGASKELEGGDHIRPNLY